MGAIARSRRTVNEHQVDLWDGFYQDDPWIAQAAERRLPPPRRPYIAPELWTKLPTEAQQLLRTFKPSAASAPTRSANLHDSVAQEPDDASAPPIWTTDESSQEPMELGESTPEEPSAEVDPEQSDDYPQPLLAHLTQRQPLPPGDVQRILAANGGLTGAC